MNNEGKVIELITAVVWGLFVVFLLGLAVNAWFKKRHQRKQKGHRRKHREWD